LQHDFYPRAFQTLSNSSKDAYSDELISDIKSPLIPKDQINIAPMDLSSNIGNEYPVIRIKSATKGKQLSLDDIDRIIYIARVLYWPELTEVKTFTEKVDIVDADGYTRILIKPKTIYESRWQMIWLPKNISGFDWPPYYKNYLEVNNGIGFRFNPGSDPLISKIDFCTGKTQEPTKIIFNFSEKLVATKNINELVKISQNDVQLVFNTDALGSINQSGEFQLHLSSKLIDPAIESNITIFPGFNSVTGNPLTDGKGNGDKPNER
jgi:hypothetical protein